MKFILIAIFFILNSCASPTKLSKSYEELIPALENCWRSRELSCVSEIYGKPKFEAGRYHFVNSEGREVLTVYLGEDSKIYSMDLNLLSTKVSSVSELKKILPTSDWKEYSVPEKTPHVVNLAVIHYSENLGAHFLSYKTDKNQEVKVLYWGGDYRNISI